MVIGNQDAYAHRDLPLYARLLLCRSLSRSAAFCRVLAALVVIVPQTPPPYPLPGVGRGHGLGVRGEGGGCRMVRL